MVKDSKEIFEQFSKKPFNLKDFIREHINGILGTVIFHMLILIAFLMMKIQHLKETTSKDVTIEFREEVMAEEIEPQEEGETEEEYYERLLEQQLRRSNIAVNEAKNIEEEISTENYVEDVMKELQQNRSEEWLKQQEELQKMLQQEDIVPEYRKPEVDEEESDYSGPTNITFSFAEPPYDRSKVRLPVPVYRCKGSGIVEVNVNVDQVGNVTSARAKVITASEDPDCLADVAETYAKRSVFEGSLSAPGNQRGKITYHFIAQ